MFITTFQLLNMSITYDTNQNLRPQMSKNPHNPTDSKNKERKKISTEEINKVNEKLVESIIKCSPTNK